MESFVFFLDALKIVRRYKRLGKIEDDSFLEEAIDAFFELSREEGIIPALESSHAVAYALTLAKEKQGESILVNLSGKGDKDIDFVVENFGKIMEFKIYFNLN